MEVRGYILPAVVCVMFLALRASTETAKTAVELIAQAHKHDNMDKMSDLSAPQNDDPSSPSGSHLQPAHATLDAHSQTRKNIQRQSITVAGVPGKESYLEPNTSEEPQKNEHAAEEPRAPPLR